MGGPIGPACSGPGNAGVPKGASGVCDSTLGASAGRGPDAPRGARSRRAIPSEGDAPNAPAPPRPVGGRLPATTRQGLSRDRCPPRTGSEGRVQRSARRCHERGIGGRGVEKREGRGTEERRRLLHGRRFTGAPGMYGCRRLPGRYDPGRSQPVLPRPDHAQAPRPRISEVGRGVEERQLRRSGVPSSAQPFAAARLCFRGRLRRWNLCGRVFVGAPCRRASARTRYAGARPPGCRPRGARHRRRWVALQADAPRPGLRAVAAQTSSKHAPTSLIR